MTVLVNYSKMSVYPVRGVHPPEVMMHFPPCFIFLPVSEKFSHSLENVPNFTFSRKLFRFSSAKISCELF